MIEHNSSWIVAASREDVWAALHPSRPLDRASTTVANPRRLTHSGVRIEIVAEGDANGQGLVRRCWYPVPWYVGGSARSWEIVSEVRVPEYQRYDVLFCTPPDATAMGSYRLDDIGDGQTRVSFHEEFHMERRLLAPLLERRVHRFISKDNDTFLKTLIERGLAAQRGTAS